MSEPLAPLEIAPRRPSGYRNLARRTSDAGKPGCALALALPLGVVGFGALWLFFSGRADDGEGNVWVVPVVGFAFALVSLVLAYAGVRGWRGRSVPTAEIALEKGVKLAPGARAFLRVRQPGPVRLRQLTVKLICERCYRRPTGRKDGSTVDDTETIWSSDLLTIADQPIGRGMAIERELELQIPFDARPSGSAAEGGQIRWAIEVWSEAGFLRGAYQPFEVVVEGDGA